MFIVESLNNKGIGLLESDLSLNDINKSIKENIESLLGTSEFHSEFIQIGNCESTGRLKITSLVVLNTVEARKFTKSKRHKGAWTWVAYDLDENQEIKSIKLTDKVDEPSIVIDTLQENQMDTIKKTIEFIRAHLNHSDIAFKFMTNKFTLKELEESFNALNLKDVTNIKKKWAYKIEETGEMSEGLAHRPAKLYRLKVERA